MVSAARSPNSEPNWAFNWESWDSSTFGRPVKCRRELLKLAAPGRVNAASERIGAAADKKVGLKTSEKISKQADVILVVLIITREL